MLTLETVLGIVIVGELLLLLYWIGGIFYGIQKGFNQVLKGLESIDARLRQLEENK